MLGNVVVIRSRESCIDQLEIAKAAAEHLKVEHNLDSLSPELFAVLDYQSFCLFVEAGVHLGFAFPEHLLELAQMGPIEDQNV